MKTEKNVFCPACGWSGNDLALVKGIPQNADYTAFGGGDIDYYNHTASCCPTCKCEAKAKFDESNPQEIWATRVKALPLELFSLPDDILNKMTAHQDGRDYRSYLRTSLEQTDADGRSIKNQCIEAWLDEIGQFDWNADWFITQINAIEAALENDSKNDFELGDLVTFTNDNGVVFEGKTIIGFEIDRGEKRYFISPTDTPWFSKRKRSLKLANNVS